MDPSLIGAIGSIIGGLVGGSSNEWVVPDYAEIRRRAEEAKINPLTALQMAPGQAATSQNYMGSAIADAALMVADAASRREETGKLSQAQAENQQLRKQVQDLTLRPKVPGIYDRGDGGPTPTLRQALGVSDGPASVGRVVDDRGGRPARDVHGGVSLAYNLGDPDITSQSDDASRVPEKDLYILGTAVQPQSGTSDAEAIGSRYGEDFMSPSWFAGWAAFASDVSAKMGNAATAWLPDGRHDGDRISVELAPPPTPAQIQELKRKYGKRPKSRDYGMPRRRLTAMGWMPY